MIKFKDLYFGNDNFLKKKINIIESKILNYSDYKL